MGARSGRSVRIHYRVLNALARITGVWFILGATWGLITVGQQSPDERWLVVGTCVFLLLAGVGLLVAKPATPEQHERFFRGIRKDSTDQRGPDEWQA